MNRLVSMFLAVALLMTTTGCQKNNNSAIDLPTDPDLDFKIGQMLMVGFKGLTVDQQSPIIEDIQQRKIGGVILFDYDVQSATPTRNINDPVQLKKLTHNLQAANPFPLFIAIDQEGGKVCRLKEKYGFKNIPSAQQLGKGDPRTTYQYALKNASQLRTLGINLNFAPVVDVNTNPANPVIGQKQRSYSSDPQVVYEHAKAVIDAHKAQGILCCLKHFPGHGSSQADSHVGFVDVTETWDPLELTPYKNLIADGYDGSIMTAHIFNSKLDPQYPATLSKPIIHDLLRTELNFKGLVFTDDMQMGAITKQYGFETAIEKAILAGCDVILLANNSAYGTETAAKAIKTIKQMLADGKIDQQRINTSYQRIRTAKQNLTN